MTGRDMGEDQMAEFRRMLRALFTQADYQERRLARYEAGGLIVSTAWTGDCGWETAILDATGAWPVERYETKEAALDGHRRWIEKLPGLVAVTRLGYGALVPAKRVQLERRALP